MLRPRRLRCSERTKATSLFKILPLQALRTGTPCNGAPIACIVTAQSTYTEHKVKWCLEISRTRVVQRKVSIRDKGKSRTVFSIINLLFINPI